MQWSLKRNRRMYLFIRVCRKHLFAWQQMHVLIAQCYIKILLRLIGTVILRGKEKNKKEVSKKQSCICCSNMLRVVWIRIIRGKAFCFSEGQHSTSWKPVISTLFSFWSDVIPQMFLYLSSLGWCSFCFLVKQTVQTRYQLLPFSLFVIVDHFRWYNSFNLSLKQESIFCIILIMCVTTKIFFETILRALSCITKEKITFSPQEMATFLKSHHLQIGIFSRLAIIILEI